MVRIPRFQIADYRNIRLAKWDEVPPVMVIAGPNGCGKSTLLERLRHEGGEGPILYVGPHRASRRQNVRMRFLAASKFQMRDILAGANLPNYEGISMYSRTRSAWDYDDASSFLKYRLCQIELDRQAAIAERWDSFGEITRGSLPDVWRPLKEMSENLLPHLKFAEIDVHNIDEIKCLWRLHSGDLTVDIDDLSSGEKSILQLFFPLIEHLVQNTLDQMRGEETERQEQNVCVLMDEPELHLHPTLQEKILEYIRTLSLTAKTQFILATHSPTIVEIANSQELFLLRPSELVPDSENQLKQIATDDEKLALLRDVFGSTSNITAMRKILVVEGRKEDETSERPSDARIYSFISEHFNQLTIMPGGGKAECKRLTESLTDILGEFSPKLKAYALLDRDLELRDPESEILYYLPVSMVENLLIDPEVVWSAIVTVRHKTEFNSPEDVDRALDEILDGMGEGESGRRVKAAVGAHTFWPSDPVTELAQQVEDFASELKNNFDQAKIEELTEEANAEIEKIRARQRRREYYHGKKILSEFYKRHLHITGMSKEIFVYECAKEASKRQSVKQFVRELFCKLEIEVTEQNS